MTPLYPSDLSDAEWDQLQPLLPPRSPHARLRRHSLRSVFEALFYLLRTGRPWRYLPANFPLRRWRRWCCGESVRHRRHHLRATPAPARWAARLPPLPLHVPIPRMRSYRIQRAGRGQPAARVRAATPPPPPPTCGPGKRTPLTAAPRWPALEVGPRAGPPLSPRRP